jgi:hypothetical protein
MYFDGANDFLRIKDESFGVPGLTLRASFTIGVWVRQMEKTGSQVIFSKTDISTTSVADNEDKLVLGLNAGVPYVVFIEVDTTQSPAVYTKTTFDDGNALADQTWSAITVSFSWDNSDLGKTTTIIGYQAGVETNRLTTDQQFSDLYNVVTLIGCANTGFNNNYTNDEFFNGFLY